MPTTDKESPATVNADAMPVAKVEGLALAAPASPAARWPGVCRRIGEGLVIGYAVLLLGIWILSHGGGDRWWLATVLIFSPRWVFAIPLVATLPAALFLSWKSRWAAAASAWIVAFPILGICIPWKALFVAEAAGARLRVMTCNIQAGNFSLAALGRVLDEADPDLVLLQEWPGTPDVLLAFVHRGWWVVTHGGHFVVASRYPLRRAEHFVIGWSHGLAATDVQAPFGRFRLYNVHLSTPRPGIESLLQEGAAGIADMQQTVDRRSRESRAARDWVAPDGSAVLAGDFNMPVESSVYRRDWSGLTNAFSSSGWGTGRTKFTRWMGVRIDHVLAGEYWHSERSWVGPDVGSDHRPLFADLYWRRGEP